MKRKDMMVIGARLRALREERGLNKSELGRLVRMRYGNIHRYERGALVTVRTVIKLANALGVSTEDLCGKELVKEDRPCGYDRALAIIGGNYLDPDTLIEFHLADTAFNSGARRLSGRGGAGDDGARGDGYGW